MISNKTTFAVYGARVSTPEGDMTLVAGTNINLTPASDSITIAAPTPIGVVINNITAYQPPSISDVNASPNSIYFSTTAGKLVYKGLDSVVHSLY